MQRTLKLTKHLAALGLATYVLAPDDPRWVHRDPSLRPPEGVTVERARYLGPRGRLPAYELFGQSAVERALRRALQLPRRLLLPDENVPWIATALPAAVRLFEKPRAKPAITTVTP